jgi:hypothetical protein
MHNIYIYFSCKVPTKYLHAHGNYIKKSILNRNLIYGTPKTTARRSAAVTLTSIGDKPLDAVRGESNCTATNKPPLWHPGLEVGDEPWRPTKHHHLCRKRGWLFLSQASPLKNCLTSADVYDHLAIEMMILEMIPWRLKSFCRRSEKAIAV